MSCLPYLRQSQLFHYSMAPRLLVYSLEAKLQSADGGKYQACSLHNCNLRRINNTFYRNRSERSPEAHKAAKSAASEAET